MQTFDIKVRPTDLEVSEDIQESKRDALIRDLDRQIRQIITLENKDYNGRSFYSDEKARSANKKGDQGPLLSTTPRDSRGAPVWVIVWGRSTAHGQVDKQDHGPDPDDAADNVFPDERQNAAPNRSALHTNARSSGGFQPSGFPILPPSRITGLPSTSLASLLANTAWSASGLLKPAV